MKAVLITESISEWMKKYYPCQLAQKDQLITHNVYTARQCADIRYVIRHLFDEPMQQHQLVCATTFSIGIQLHQQTVKRIVCVVDYRQQSFDAMKQIVYEQLALMLATNEEFENCRIRIVMIFPQIAPQIIVAYERIIEQLQKLVLKLGYLIEWEIIIPTQSIPIERQQTIVKKSVETQLTNALLRQLRRYRTQLPQSVWESLQDISFVKMNFEIEYPLLMSHHNFLRSGYRRSLFAKQLLILKGKEYYVFDQISKQEYQRFLQWLDGYIFTE
ncbi:MAG: hypothetical protein ACRDAO_06360 [Culicoidibacterales bacterium]